MKRSIIFGAAIVAASLPVPAFAQSASDFTCANFSTQQEAQRFYEHNHASWLDSDHDGIACEELPVFVRDDGQQVYRGSVSSRWDYELIRSADGVYARSWSQDDPSQTLFSTVTFSNQDDARTYLNQWFW